MKNLDQLSETKKIQSFIPSLDSHISKFVPVVMDNKNYPLVKRQGDMYFRNENEYDYGNFLMAVNEFSLGDSAGAIKRLKYILQIEPLFAGAHHLYITILLTIKENELYKKAIYNAVNHLPNDASLLNVLGKYLIGIGKKFEALENFEKSVEQDPKVCSHWTDLGFCYYMIRNIQMATLCLSTALKIDPMHKQCVLFGAIMFQEYSRHTEALDLYKQGLKLYPKDQNIITNLAMLYLKLGDKKRGYKYYSMIDTSKRTNQKNLIQEVKNITDLNENHLSLNKKYKILVYFEQGFGDYLNFYRFLKPLVKLGHSVTAFGEKSMISLLKYSSDSNNINLISTIKIEDIKKYDYKTFITCIPNLLGLTKKTPPPISLNLKKLENDKKFHSCKLKKLFGKKNIGVSWKGSKAHIYDESRSIDLSIFYKLFKNNKNTYFVIDKEINENDRKILKKFKNVIICDEFIKDWTDTALIVSNLDEVITVDTSLAHISGTLNIPTKILIAKEPDWRWGIKGTKTEWYKSVKLVRQKEADNWDKVIDNLVKQY